MSDSFDLRDKVAVVTGGYGTLGGSLADGLARAHARVAILGRDRVKAEEKAQAIRDAGGEAIALQADVLDEAQLKSACAELIDKWQRVDILVNAAGGSVARSRNDKSSIFDVPFDATEEVLRLNLHGTMVPTFVFAEAMARQRSGCVVSISSMAATRVLSGVLGYSVAKSGVENFTRWMAVELARKHGDGLRVNAIAPGFFVAKQNRDVLIKPDGTYTERAQRVIAQTPMGRFGQPEELVGAVQWLCSSAASFVTGVVIPVDGGFSLFSGV